MTLFRELEDRFGEAIAHQHLGQICIYAGDDSQARIHVERSLAIGGELKHMEIQSECQRMLGELALAAGDVDEASRWIAASLEVCQQAGDKRGEATALFWMGKVDLVAGKASPARIKLGGALRAFRAFDMWGELLDCLEDHAVLAYLDGHFDDAARLLGAADNARKRQGVARKRIAQDKWLQDLSVIRERLGNGAFDEAWTQGQSWEIKEAVGRILRTRPVELV